MSNDFEKEILRTQFLKNDLAKLVENANTKNQVDMHKITEVSIPFFTSTTEY